MRSFLLITLLAIASLAASPAFAGPWKVLFQDEKFPTQVAMEHDQWVNPLGASTVRLKSGAAISSSAATTISTFAAQPDFARNITLTPTGTTNSVAAGTAVVSGLNLFGKSISENFTISSAQSTATTGSKAFKTVTSVVFPQASASGATLSIGIGTKLGMRRCMAQAGDYDWSVYGGTYESTRGTIAASATAIESNTFIPTGTEDGAHQVDMYYVQNYRCYPGQ